MSTAEVEVRPEEAAVVARLSASGARGWQELGLAGVARVAHAFAFEHFGWYVLVTERRLAFFRAVTDIYTQSALILGISLLLSVALLLLLSSYLTRPLRGMVEVIRGIMANNDLSRRVEPMYRDEAGELATTFNAMTSELEKAYDQIRAYAFQAVVAQKREARIRNIFQKYVPKDVIEEFFRHPEAMLVGQNRDLTVLFTDIRDFTSLSQNLTPEKVVESLNAYFGTMVDIIAAHRGIVDKYIGDAIMAFFGAPVRHDDDIEQAVTAGLEMLDALDHFNEHQLASGRVTFKMGVGINYGSVTVGNIGSERKMDYTVIGDMVNVASRLEGLTKTYRVPLIVSETVQAAVQGTLPCRLLDNVLAKGMLRPVKVYAVRRQLTDAERSGWDLHAEGLACFYRRQFQEAADCFQRVRALLPDDRVSELHLERSLRHLASPPEPEWQGIAVISEK